MKLRLAIAAAAGVLLLSACAGSSIGLRSTNSPSIGVSTPPPGSAYYSGSVAIQADASPGVYFGMILLGYIMTGIQDNFQTWGYAPYSRRPPEMAEDRAVVERDCTQPLEPQYANLRCK